MKVDKEYIENRMGDLGLRNAVVRSVGSLLEGLPQNYADSVINTLRATYIDQRTKISV